MPTAFYELAGPAAFAATPATAGPWNEQHQHGGPPSALAARALELHEPVEAQRLARVTIDILGPIPITKLTIATRTVRPGRRISLVEAVMTAGGREVLHARGWRLARNTVVPESAAGPAPPPLPAQSSPAHFPGGHMGGYMSAVEWRFLHGSGFHQPGQGRVWTRPTIPLLAGEEPSAMSRVLLIADSGNGVSAMLDPARFLFVNVDLTVVLPARSGRRVAVHGRGNDPRGRRGSSGPQHAVGHRRPVRLRPADPGGRASLTGMPSQGR